MKNSCLRWFPGSLAVAGLFLGFATFAFAAEPVPGSLVAKADLVKLVGRDLGAPMSIPEGMDDDLGAKQTTSIYSAGDLKVIVAVFTFPSAKEAAAKLTKKKLAELIDEENPKAVTVNEESGVGDRAFWSVCKEGAGFTVVKGQRVLAIALAGELPRPAASYHDSLRSLSSAAAGKL
jgi:hypothetical protein